MAQSVTARAAGRGFPVFDVAGQSGQGALQDSTAPPPAAGLPSATWTDPNQDPGSVPAALPPPEVYALGGSLWGLPGSPNPDDSPKSAPGPQSPQGGTHAAPIADPSLPVGEYYAEADAAHGPVFTSVAVRNDVGTRARFALDHPGIIEANGETILAKTSGQQRLMAGRDGQQGYGGGGPGPRGTNEPELTTDQRFYPGQTYNGQPGTFVSAAEVPLLVADADQFIASAPELPAYAPTFDVPTASVHAQDVTGADVPAQGAALQAAQPAYVTSFWS